MAEGIKIGDKAYYRKRIGYQYVTKSGKVFRIEKGMATLQPAMGNQFKAKVSTLTKCKEQ